MDFSEVVGSFGPWQRRVFLFFLIFNVVGMWQNFSIVFLAPNVSFHCVQPNRSASLNFDDQCEVAVGPNSTVSCKQWEYNTSLSSQTIVSEWDLVCDREWLVSLAKSSYMFGFLLSVIVFGQISDCVGRYPTIVMCYIIVCVSMFLTLFSNSFIMFVILRFFHGFGRAGASTVGYVLTMEIVGSKHKTEIGIALQLGWTAGYVSLVGVAWFIRHWFWLQLVISLAFMPFAFALWFVPESPRWLLTRGRFNDLQRLLEKAATLNKCEVKEGIKHLTKLRNENKVKKVATIFEVLKMPKMRKRTLCMIYIWFVNIFLYYALSYNTNDLAGNPYLNFFISGMVEFPSKGLVFCGIKKWGRRPTLISCMAVATATNVALLFVPSDLTWLMNTFAMVGKFCVTGSFSLLYLYTAELFPTEVRNVTLGSCSMCARIGSILSPFLRDLGKATHLAVPNILCSLLSLTGAGLASMLPETRGLDLPNTLQEGEELGEFQKGQRTLERS